MLEINPIAQALQNTTIPNEEGPIHVFGQTDQEMMTWDEVEAVYDQIAHSVIQIGVTVNTFVAMKEIYPYIDPAEMKELPLLIEGLGSDLTTFSSILAAIHAQHEGMTGNIENEDQISHAGSIMGEYGRFATHLESATMQVSTRITGAFEEAIAKIKVENPELFTALQEKYTNELLESNNE